MSFTIPKETNYLNGMDLQFSNLFEAYFSDKESFKFFVKSISVPLMPEIEYETLSTGQKFFRSVKHIDSVDLVLYENNYFEVSQYFYGWFQKIYDYERNLVKSDAYLHMNKTLMITTECPFTIGTQFVKSQFGLATVVTPVPIANNTTPSAFFQLENVKLTKVSDISLDYATGDPITLTVSLSVESVKFIPTVNLGTMSIV